MACAHTLVKGGRLRIGLDCHPNRAEISRFRRCPLEQQATNARSQQRRLNKELQQVCVSVGDLDLSQSNNSGTANGHLKACGLEFVGTECQFSPASCQECVVVTPNSFRAQTQFT
jgi:hypothetical protein